MGQRMLASAEWLLLAVGLVAATGSVMLWFGDLVPGIWEFVVLLAVAALVALLMARRITAPLTRLAREAEADLQSRKYEKFFAKMYGNKPTAWDEALSGYERLRLIVNVFTRMRVLTYLNELDYDFKATLDKMPLYLRPWFRVPNRQNLSHTIIFGHWSSLGYMNENNIISLDTGALWGGELTAVNLATHEVTQVPSQSGLDWKTLLLK